jgi:hypothetical protein
MPTAIQVADRWHLTGDGQPGLSRCRAQIHAVDYHAVGSPTINPELLTSAEKRNTTGICGEGAIP